MTQNYRQLAGETDHPGQARKPNPLGGAARFVYLLLAGVFFALAVLGVLLPVLPTTPFLLLTSYFLVRSSPALHKKLLRSRTFGRLLRDWQRHRAVRPHVKRTTLIVMPAAVLGSAYFGNLGPLGMVILFSAGVVGFIVVARLRVISE